MGSVRTVTAPSRIDRTAAGVLFDMDGTLVDSTPIVVAAWTAFGLAHDLDPATILAFSHGRQTIDTIRHFFPDHTPDEQRAIAEELVGDEVARTDGIAEIPGAAAFVTALTAAGARIALVTSAPRGLALDRMAAAGVPVPDVVVTAEDVEHGKPAPDCYLHAAALLRLAPADCIAFEDADAGLSAAVAAGAQTVVVGEHESAVTAGLDRLVDLRDVVVTTEGDRVRVRG